MPESKITGSVEGPRHTTVAENKVKIGLGLALGVERRCLSMSDWGKTARN